MKGYIEKADALMEEWGCEYLVRQRNTLLVEGDGGLDGGDGLQGQNPPGRHRFLQKPRLSGVGEAASPIHGLGLSPCARTVLNLSLLNVDDSEQGNDWTEQANQPSSHKGSGEGVHGSAFAWGQAGGKASADANDDGQCKQFHRLKR
ncbi:hypothetical protein [Parasynechococcus marenigrum]|uniref:Uncharacterized protein n=1 Tax=Parasynechococcus marenigrum (strain WH8102) TaxID=84588 RepID=Q7U6D8_PARMW|nr:hypothetical protein [Parasynechococcus marenigrum]CAE07915.1 hypothetical [Parasynechococcus marenigrum WH 8102]